MESDARTFAERLASGPTRAYAPGKPSSARSRPNHSWACCEGCPNLGSCRGPVVFVQQTTQETPPTHGRGHRGSDRPAGSLGRRQLEPPMWPFGIVVMDVDSEHGLQVRPIQDKE